MSLFPAPKRTGYPYPPQAYGKSAASPAQPAPSLPLQGERVATVELWRFIFTVLVCLYHFEMFFPKRQILLSGSGAVEFFFVLAGFAMALSARRSLSGRESPVTMKEAAQKAAGYVLGRLKTVYPVILVVMFIYFFLLPSSLNENTLRVVQNSEWEFTMMVGTPFGFNNGAAPNIPMWFLTALLLAGYLYTFALYKYNDFTMFAAPAIGVLFYSYFTLNSSLVLDFSIKMGFLTAGMVKAVAEIALGIAIFGLYERLLKIKFGLFWQIILSLAEVYAIYRFFALTVCQPIGMDNFRRIVYILLIILLSFLNVTLLSRRLNKGFFRALGRISLPMYLSHFFVAQLYFPLLSYGKSVLLKMADPTNPQDAAMAWYNFLKNTGGYDPSFKPIGMSGKDMFLFIVLVVAVSLVIMLYIALVRAACRSVKRVREAKAANREADYVIHLYK